MEAGGVGHVQLIIPARNLIRGAYPPTAQPGHASPLATGSGPA
jgi:hypothetical protein